MRCKICDFSPDMPGSIYRDCLTKGAKGGSRAIRTLSYDEKTGTYNLPCCSSQEVDDEPLY